MKYVNLEIDSKIINKDVQEYYNALAINIQFLGKDMKKIVISSVFENEGKSTISLNLSVNLSNMGYRVLLIDSDLRNSVLIGKLKFNEEIKGLTSYLSGIVDLENVIYKSNFKNLDLIPVDRLSLNPLNLLQNKAFDEMLDILNEKYDYIIIDTPPIGVVMDAAIITKKCDGSILVVESGRIRRKYVKKAKMQLESAGSKFLGVILNKADVNKIDYGKYGNYENYREREY